MERLFTEREHWSSTRMNLVFGFILGGLFVLCLFKLFGGTFNPKPTSTGEVRIAAERKAHEVEMLERLKTVELPATVLTETGDFFWVVNRYKHSETFIEAILMWPDDTRDHRDIRTLVHNIKLIAGRNENREVQVILSEWWNHKTLWIK